MSTPVHLCYVGDGENYHVRKWLPALAREGLTVTLLTFDPPSVPINGVTARRLSRPLPFLSKPTYFDFLKPRSELRKSLDELGCDVLLGSYATHYGWMAARTGFRPFVLQTWTGDLTTYPFSGVKRLFFRPIVTGALRRADLITTDGRALLEEGRRLFPRFAGKMIATRWGIDVNGAIGLAHRGKQPFSRSRGISNLDDYTVVTSPRGLQHWYRPELVLHAITKSVESDERVFAVLLTLGHERSDALAGMLTKISQHPRVMVIDEFLSSDAMNELWLATDVVVSVPHSDGISESVLEAVYSGAIPVLSDIASNRSLVSDGLQATLVGGGESRDPGALAEAIVAACSLSDQTASSMREHNHEWVRENATVERTAADLATHIRSLATNYREKEE